jgi:hypothetical protein
MVKSGFNGDLPYYLPICCKYAVNQNGTCALYEYTPFCNGPVMSSLPE